MKVIIIDDEPKAIALLKNYLQHFGNLCLEATFRNGLKALEYIAQNKVDLIFLDINMPHISGIALSRMLNPGSCIVFTTAYSEYAVESYEVQAVDYLLKPISLERFTQTISKIMKLGQYTTPIDHKILLIKSGSRIHRVDPLEIEYLEKEGNYITYHLGDRKIVGRGSVAEALHILPESFLQSHKSYIVNIHQITSIDKDTIHLAHASVPIGATFKESFLKLIDF